MGRRRKRLNVISVTILFAYTEEEEDEHGEKED